MPNSQTSELQELRAENERLRADLKRAREMQAFLFNLVPEEKLVGALLAAYIERGEQ